MIIEHRDRCTSSEWRPVGHLERHVLIVVQDGDACDVGRCHKSFLSDELGADAGLLCPRPPPACVSTKKNQRASFPPSTAMDAPVMKEALSDATNRTV